MERNLTGNIFCTRVQEKLASLSKKERETAEYMAAHQEELIYTSITELAELVGTSEATITRVCGKLGYPGFQALKVNVARELVTPQKRIHEDLPLDASAEAIVEKVFSSAIKTLELTLEALDAAAVSKSIDALCAARRIVILGNGNSGSIAMDAQHKFLRIGLNASAYTDDHLQMIAVSALTAEDVMLTISHSGSSRNAVEAARQAKERGAKVISITNAGTSPVTKLADICLYTHSQETKYRTNAISSRMAELTIADVLYTGIALRKGEQTLQRFEAMEKALTVKKY